MISCQSIIFYSIIIKAWSFDVVLVIYLILSSQVLYPFPCILSMERKSTATLFFFDPEEGVEEDEGVDNALKLVVRFFILGNLKVGSGPKDPDCTIK